VPLLLVVLLVVVPLVEVYVLVQVGQAIGALPTIAILVAMSLLGAYLLRREGSRTWKAFRGAIGTGRVPTREVVDGGLVSSGGRCCYARLRDRPVRGALSVLPPSRGALRRVLTGLVAAPACGTRRMGPLGGHACRQPPAPRGRAGWSTGGVDRPPRSGRAGAAPRCDARSPPPRGTGLCGRVVRRSSCPSRARSQRGLDLALVVVQDGQALGQDLLELGGRAPLEQHVPVRAGRLALLLLGLLGVAQQRGGAADAALPRRRDVGLGRERHGGLVAGRAVVRGAQARGELGVPVALVAHSPEAGASQDAVAHGVPPVPGVCPWSLVVTTSRRVMGFPDVRHRHPFGSGDRVTVLPLRPARPPLPATLRLVSLVATPSGWPPVAPRWAS
jgi:UPF0716 protein FxsA